MSDREYILEEIRKIFKEQAAPGALAKVAGTISPPPKKEPKYTLTRRKKAGGTLSPRDNKDADANLTISSDKVKKGLKDAGVTPQEYKEYFEKLSNGAIKPNSDFWLKQKFSFDRYGDISFSKMSDIARALGGKKKPSTSTVSVDPKVQKNKKPAIVTIGDVITYDPSIPEEYKRSYHQAKISPGMDSGDSGDCKFINSAAIKENPKLENPVYIYQVLANAGIVALTDPIPLKPCDGLDKLVARFQDGAIKGTLRFQSKRSAKNIKKLYYTPKVATRNLAPDLKTASDKSKPPVNEQSDPNQIAVDGKIGSRTARLFKLFQPDIKPSVKEPVKRPVAPPPEVAKKKPTSTGSSKATSVGACSYFIQNELDLKLQIAQTIVGIQCKDRGLTNERYQTLKKYAEPGDFDDIRAAVMEGVNYSDTDLDAFIQRKNKMSNLLINKQPSIIAFLRKQANAPKRLQDRQFQGMKSFTENLSSMIVSLYVSQLGKMNTVYSFAFYKNFNLNTDKFEYYPIIFTSGPQSGNIANQFIQKGLQNMKFTLKKGGNTVPITQDMFGFREGKADFEKAINNLYGVFKETGLFYNDVIRSGLASKLQYLEDSYVLKDAPGVLIRHRKNLKDLINYGREFMSNPNEETLKKFAIPCALVSGVYRRLDNVAY